MLEAEHDGSKPELRLGELNRPSKIIITQQLLVILARRNATLDLRLLQPPDLHHFLGNCPGRSQKFVAPHSKHAYFGTRIHPEQNCRWQRPSALLLKSAKSAAPIRDLVQQLLTAELGLRDQLVTHQSLARKTRGFLLVSTARSIRSSGIVLKANIP